jgi:hypothetical protein
MAPTAMLATELPARACLFAAHGPGEHPQGPGPGQIAAVIGTIPQLLITLGQSEAPHVIVQAITITRGATGAG